MFSRRILIIAGVIVLLIGGGAAYYFQRQAAQRAAEAAALRTEVIATGDILSTVSASGSIAPEAQVNLAKHLETLDQAAAKVLFWKQIPHFCVWEGT